MATVTYRVTLELPEGATSEDARTYIEDAIRSFAGSLRPPLSYSNDDPGDAFFDLDRASVKVTRHMVTA